MLESLKLFSQVSTQNYTPDISVYNGLTRVMQMHEIEQLLRTLSRKAYKGLVQHRIPRHEQYVTELLTLEFHKLEVNRIKRMFKTASFQFIKILDEFEWRNEIEPPAGLTMNI